MLNVLERNDAAPGRCTAIGWLFGGILLAAVTLYRVLPDDRTTVRLARALIAGGLFMSLLTAAATAALSAAIGIFRPVRAAAHAVVVAAGAGFLGNAVLVAGLARHFDAPLHDALARARALDGFLELHTADGGRHWLRRTSALSWQHTEPCTDVPDLAVHILVAVEDRRFFLLPGTMDPRALARAAWSVRASGRPTQGASGLSAQLAGMLLDIDTRRDNAIRRVRSKLRKMLAAERLDDLMSRRDIAGTYLRLAPFGSIVPGHESIGICHAARAAYAKNVDSLTVAELAELIGRLPATERLIPVRRSREGEQAWAARHDALVRNHHAVLDELSRSGLTAPWVGQLPLLAPDASRLSAITVNRLPAIFGELNRLGLDPAHSRLRVHAAPDAAIQVLLDDAVRSATPEMHASFDAMARGYDQIRVDATVVDEHGGIIAETGLATVRSGSSSIEKPNAFADALEAGVLRSLRDSIDGTTAFDALVASSNPVALSLVERRGAEHFYRLTALEGERPNGIFPALVLGAGVTITPRLVAGSYTKWAPWGAGMSVEPSLVTEVSDRDTGDVLHGPRWTRRFSRETSRAVAEALAAVPVRGTASILRPLASGNSLLVKTGTAGFLRDGRRLGEGGSHIAGCDTIARVCFAIRVRWESGKPFELPGGRSAALVLRHFIPRLRTARGFQQ